MGIPMIFPFKIACLKVYCEFYFHLVKWHLLLLPSFPLRCTIVCREKTLMEVGLF